MCWRGRQLAYQGHLFPIKYTVGGELRANPFQILVEMTVLYSALKLGSEGAGEV